MRYVKRILVILALAAFANAAQIALAGASKLRPRRLFTPSQTRDELVPFEELHARYFADVKVKKKPPSTQTLRRYSDTYFYNNKPVLEAGLLGVSRSRLLAAYQNFDEVHVMYPARNKVVTISSKMPPTSGYHPQIVEQGLEHLLLERRLVEQHFGRGAAIAAFGRNLEPKTRWNAWKLRLQRTGPSREPNSGLLHSDATTSEVREALQQRYELFIESNDGRSFLSLKADERGVISRKVEGRIREVFNSIRNRHL